MINTFDHDFFYSFSFFVLPSFLRGGREKEERITKLVVKSHAFLLDLCKHSPDLKLLIGNCNSMHCRIDR